MRTLIFAFLFLSLLLPNTSTAQEVNAGFVQGLWYSNSPVFEKVPTRIYVALRNNTEHDLTATIRFSIDGARIGSSDVRALSGRLVEAWVDWTPTKGTHTVSAQVSNAELHIIGEGAKKIDVAGMTAEETLFVDVDTDNDGVGNEEDADDDGDGILDEDEIGRGTNPLKADGNATQSSAPESRSDTVEEEKEQNETPSSVDSGEGLERFIPEGTTNSVLTSVTEKIDEAKKSLDDYRETRAQNQEGKTGDQTVSDSEPEISGTTTITRTRIEPKVGLFERFVQILTTLISTIWSFVLLFFSFILGFPALIELILLWAILIFIYRTARRYGRRKNS